MNTAAADRLAQPLDAKRIKQRAAGGNRPALSYLETHDVIRTANDIFGFGGWGHEVVELRGIPPVTVHNSDQKPGISVGYVCVVRLQVRGCEPTSGVGFGDATEYRESAGVTAHELAAKEAESDALKRALKNFGDQFGLALYSKDAAKDGHVTSSPAAAAGGRRASGEGTSTPPPDAPPTNGAGDEWTFPIGKHKGKTLSEVPRNYVEWFVREGTKQDVKEMCELYLQLEESALVGGGAQEAFDDSVPF